MLPQMRAQAHMDAAADQRGKLRPGPFKRASTCFDSSQSAPMKVDRFLTLRALGKGEAVCVDDSPIRKSPAPTGDANLSCEAGAAMEDMFERLELKYKGTFRCSL